MRAERGRGGDLGSKRDFQLDAAPSPCLFPEYLRIVPSEFNSHHLRQGTPCDKARCRASPAHCRQPCYPQLLCREETSAYPSTGNYLRERDRSLFVLTIDGGPKQVGCNACKSLKTERAGWIAGPFALSVSPQLTNGRIECPARNDSSRRT